MEVQSGRDTFITSELASSRRYIVFHIIWFIFLNLYAHRNVSYRKITTMNLDGGKKYGAANQVIIDFRAYEPYHRVLFPLH